MKIKITDKPFTNKPFNPDLDYHSFSNNKLKYTGQFDIFADKKGNIYSYYDGEFYKRCGTPVNKKVDNNYFLISRCKKHLFAHRLVAMAWIDNPDNLACVNHKNFNRQDNRISNLEWITHEDNVRHYFTNRDTRKRSGKHHLSIRDYEQIRELHSMGYSQYKLANMFDTTQPMIHYIVKQGYKTLAEQKGEK